MFGWDHKSLGMNKLWTISQTKYKETTDEPQPVFKISVKFREIRWFRPCPKFFDKQNSKPWPQHLWPPLLMTSSYVLNYMPHGDLVYNKKLKSALCGGRGKSHEPAGVGRSRGNEHGGRKKEETCVHGCVVQSLRVAFSETLGRRRLLCLSFQSSTPPTKLGNMAH